MFFAEVSIRIVQMFLVIVLTGAVFGIHTPRISAAAPTALTAIETANFSAYRSDISTKLTTLRGMSDTMTAATFDVLRANPTNAAYMAHLAFIDAYGLSTLNTYAKPAANKPFLRWLFTTADVIPALLAGGTPVNGRGSAALAILQRIWSADTAARSGVLRKLAIAVALSHANPVTTGWYRVNASGVADTIDPLGRYTNYKTARAAKQLDAGFDGLSIWHMRMVVDAWARDVDLNWLRTTYKGPHRITSETGVARVFTTTYTRTNIGDSGYELEYRDTNAAGRSVQSGTLAFYGPNADIARVLQVGGVCGAIAKYGSTVAQAYGIPAFPVGQPGHAAAFISNAPSTWVMHNDIYGMGGSFRHDGTTIPLMSDTYGSYNDAEAGIGDRDFAPAYVLLYEVLSGPRAATFARSEWLRWAARGVTSAPIRQRMLDLAVIVEPMNVLAWRDRISAANANVRTTTAQWQSMFTSITAAFASQPRVLTELSNRIERRLVPSASSASTKAAYVQALFSRYDAIPATSPHAAIRDVILAALPVWIRTYIPAPNVSVSFSGSTAGQVTGFKSGMALSVDAGTTWITPATTDFSLKIAHIAALQSSRVLYVRNRYSTSTDITRAQAIPLTVHAQSAPALVANDVTDTLTGLTPEMEYSTNNGKTWTTVGSDHTLDLSRHTTIITRYRGNGTMLPSAPSTHVFSVPLNWAQNVLATDTRSYAGHGGSRAVDGNDETNWLVDTSISTSDVPVRLVIDLGASRTIDALNLLWTQNTNAWEGYASGYTIATADTSSEPTVGSIDWQTVATVSDGNGGRDIVSFGAVRARFVRLSITQSAGRDASNWKWPSLYSVAVTGADTIPSVGLTSGAAYLSDRLWNSESAYAVENGSDTTCDKYHTGGRIILDGTAYLKGIGLCFSMTLQYVLDGTHTTFVADVGVDDQEPESDTRQVMFEVIADANTVYKSPTMTAASSKQAINVDITGTKLLTIKYYSVDGSHPPYAIWADASLR